MGTNFRIREGYGNIKELGGMIMRSVKKCYMCGLDREVTKCEDCGRNICNGCSESDDGPTCPLCGNSFEDNSPIEDDE